jgi:hypothetical protein
MHAAMNEYALPFERTAVGTIMMRGSILRLCLSFGEVLAERSVTSKLEDTQFRLDPLRLFGFRNKPRF